MRIVRIAASAAVLVGMLASLPIGAMAGSKHSAIFVANTYNVAAFPTGSHGNVAPIVLNTDMADPLGLARDKSGRIYVSNSATNTVTIYPANSDGNVAPIAVIAGSNTRLAGPTRIALDENEKIYVLNAAENFQSINVYPRLGASTGILNEAAVARIAGSKTLLDYPYGIALDSDQNIYVANASGGRVVPHEIYDVGSVTVYPAGSSGNIEPMAVISGSRTGLALPLGIAVDSEGKIYVGNGYTANTKNSSLIAHSSVTVYARGSKGNVAPIATIAGGNTSLIDLENIALDSLGNLYTAGCGDVYCFTVNTYSPGSNGNVAPAAVIFGADTELFVPIAMTLDAERNLYVLSNEGGPAGDGFVSVYPADSNGDTPPSSKITSNFDWLDGASAVAVDSAGKIYVASEFSGDPNGSISIFPVGSYASGGPPIATITGADTELSRPYAIALDAADNLYVLNDTDEITVYPAGSVGDATPSAFFIISSGESFPTGMAVNPRGKLYVTIGASVKCNRRSCEETTHGKVFVYPIRGNGNPSAIVSGPNTKLESPSAVAVDHSGNIYVANQGTSQCKPNGSGSITVYSANSNGNTAPIATIAGTNTGLTFPNGITFDSSGNIYVSNGPAPSVCLPRISPPIEGAILVFAPRSNGNVAPISSIKGPATGLNSPLGIAVGPSDH